MEQEQLEQLSGSVEEIIFQNDTTGFAVVELNTGDELIPVVGELCGVAEGEELKVTGVYATHPTFGYQFKAMGYERQFPATAAAIGKYLASGVIKGIGPVAARKIVERFGDETLEVIENQPLLLAQVSGISEKKAQRIGEAFREIAGLQIGRASCRERVFRAV